MRGMAFASIMGVLALMVHSSVDFNLQIPANAMMFVGDAGLWAGLRGIASGARETNRSPARKPRLTRPICSGIIAPLSGFCKERFMKSIRQLGAIAAS